MDHYLDYYPDAMPPGTPETDLAVLTALANPRHGGLTDIARRAGVSVTTARRATRRLQLMNYAVPGLLPASTEPTAEGRQWMTQAVEEAKQSGRESCTQGRLEQLAKSLETISAELRKLANREASKCPECPDR